MENAKIWEITQKVIDAIKNAPAIIDKAGGVDKVCWDSLAEDWFDYLEEQINPASSSSTDLHSGR